MTQTVYVAVDQAVTIEVGPEAGPKGDQGIQGIQGVPGPSVTKTAIIATGLAAGDIGAATPASVSTAIANQRITDGATFGPLAATSAPVLASAVTKGLYVRTQPLPDGGSSFRPVAKDPNQTGVNGTGRLWGVGSHFGQIGYSDDDGATFVAKSTLFRAGVGLQSIVFSNNWMYLLFASATGPSTGDLWRIPLPDVNGMATGIGTGASANQWVTSLSAGSNGAALPQATINIANGNYFNVGGGTVTVITTAGPQVVTYTGKTAGTLTGCSGGTGTMATGGLVLNALRVMGLDNLVNGPGGSVGAGGVNSTLRNSCFAVAADDSHAYICEYGTANSTVAQTAWADGVMAAGANLLFGAADTATASMVGLTITVGGAGSAGGTLTAKVLAVVAASGSACLQLSAPALTTVTAAAVTFPSTTYGAGVVVGGPSVYHSSNIGGAVASVTWTKVQTFPGTKHAHAVKIINGLPWVSLGDYGFQFPDTGLWVATSAAATTWNKRSVAPSGTAKDPINFLVASAFGSSIVLAESDNGTRDGPLMFADVLGAVTRVMDSTCKIPAPYTQTMRGLSLLSNGNAMWFGTGEAQAVGPTSCVWLSRSPYTVPVLIEDVGSALDAETVGDPVVSNGYIWFGTFRCAQEKFTDQA